MGWSRGLVSIYAILISVHLGGCTAGMEASDSLMLRQLRDYTGGIRPGDHVPYTAASNDHLLQDVKTKIDAYNFGNQKLGNSLIQVKNSYKNETYDLEIELIDPFSEQKTLLKFSGKMEEDGNHLKSEELKDPSNHKYTTMLTCFDRKCHLSMIMLFLGGAKNPNAVAGFVLRNNKAHFKSYGASPSSHSAQLKAHTRSIAEVNITSVEVAHGPAWIQANVSDQFCFRAELIETNETDESLNLACAKSDFEETFNIKSAFLVGNTNSGDWIFQIFFKDDSSLFMSLFTTDRELDLVADVPLEDEPPHIDDGKNEGYLRINWNSYVTKKFRESFTRDKVIEKRNSFKTTDRVQNYINGLIPRLGEITPYFDEHGVPQELMMVTWTESDYFTSPGYPVRIGADGEVGPYQIMKATGRGNPMNLRVFDLIHSNGKKVHNRCDERANLKKASEAAAKYFAWLLKSFPKDPHLAVLSYNWGIGHVRGKVSSLERAHDEGFQFWTMVQFNMIPKFRVSYVTKFLGIFSLIGDPEANGYSIPRARPYTPTEPEC